VIAAATIFAVGVFVFGAGYLSGRDSAERQRRAWRRERNRL
jgi:hypothetical protein